MPTLLQRFLAKMAEEAAETGQMPQKYFEAKHMYETVQAALKNKDFINKLRSIYKRERKTNPESWRDWLYDIEDKIPMSRIEEGMLGEMRGTGETTDRFMRSFAKEEATALQKFLERETGEYLKPVDINAIISARGKK